MNTQYEYVNINTHTYMYILMYQCRIMHVQARN